MASPCHMLQSPMEGAGCVSLTPPCCTSTWYTKYVCCWTATKLSRQQCTRTCFGDGRHHALRNKRVPAERCHDAGLQLVL